MKNNLIHKTAAGLLALSIITGAYAVSTTANAAEAPIALTSASSNNTVSYDAETGILTLSGNVDRSELINFTDYSKVRTIIADETAVLPTDSHDLFKGFSRAVKIDLSNANTSAVTNMSGIFSGCSALKELNISSFATENVTDMSHMFYNCRSLTDLDVSVLNTAKVTDMSHMFSKCESLSSLDLSGFDTSEVTCMHNMFGECYNLTELDLSSFNTSKVTEMHLMFDHCTKLSALNISSFDTSSATDMSRMFGDCSVLADIDVSRFNTANVSNLSFMFYNCKVLTELDLSSFSTESAENVSSMFRKTPLEKITLGSNFKKVTWDMGLRNSADHGWINVNAPGTTVSGTNSYAVFDNNGKNTYLYTDSQSFIAGASITLDGSIGINFYAALTAEQKSGAYIVFSGNCDENGQQISVINNKAVCHISAKNMCDDITATLYVDGNAIDSKSISVKNYADAILADPVNFAGEQDIVKAMLNYGGKAQKLFGYSTDNTADSSIDYTGSAFSYNSSFKKPADITGVSYYGSSLILRSKTIVRHYFKITGPIADYSFICNGDVSHPKQYGNTEYYYIDSENLSAADLDSKTTITIRKGKERLSLTYSPLDYVKSVLAEDSTQPQNVKDASLALYWYYKAANAYITK